MSVYKNHDPGAALVPLSRILNICDFEPRSEHVLSVVTNLDKEEQSNDCWPLLAALPRPCPRPHILCLKILSPDMSAMFDGVQMHNTYRRGLIAKIITEGIFSGSLLIKPPVSEGSAEKHPVCR